MSLDNKVAIVTGGNSGIGKAVVLALAEQGASVVIDYIAHPEATDELERKIADLGGRAVGVNADVSKVADLERLVDAAINALRPAGRDGQQRRRGDADLGARHHRGAVRARAGRQSQERLLRHPAGGRWSSAARDEPRPGFIRFG
jgi:NAD(P)-dependent dehydrogenase (short-subunit alcohol dehydrogenase family)